MVKHVDFKRVNEEVAHEFRGSRDTGVDSATRSGQEPKSRSRGSLRPAM